MYVYYLVTGNYPVESLFHSSLLHLSAFLQTALQVLKTVIQTGSGNAFHQEIVRGMCILA